MKAIVTTTINPPTKALGKFIEIAARDDWQVFIIGDQKTPHEPYMRLSDKHKFVHYFTPVMQETDYPKLSELIGWNCIQRRNFGMVYAHRAGAEIIAVVDDDNIPYDNWGQNLLIDQTVKLDIYDSPGEVFNPLARFDFGYKTVNMCHDPEGEFTKPIWHRGVPEQQIELADYSKLNPQEIQRKENRLVLVQADMWDGDPDISAMCRMVLHPDVKFTHENAYAGVKPGPFNSQNTFLHRDVMLDYFLFPHIGRMDDIWASYVVQAKFPNCVAYGLASVYQERNPHDLSKDLANELIGTLHTPELVQWLYKHAGNPADPTAWPAFMPKVALEAYTEYRRIIQEGNDERRDDR